MYVNGNVSGGAGGALLDDVKGTSAGRLSVLSVWALSFGSAIGWGAFIMPGTMFLPIAGPLGTLVGFGVSILVMMLIAVNYHYMIQRYPDNGGAFSYVKSVCNYDHGYLCAWFLILTYVAIVWANATALALIGRNFFGDVFQFGFCYKVFGYDVYAGDIVVSIAALLVVNFVVLRGRRRGFLFQSAFALVLSLGVLLCFALVAYHIGGVKISAPSFSVTSSGGKAFQIFSIVVIAPWAVVGFESVSHTVEEFRFNRRLVFWIFATSLVAIGLTYGALTLLATWVHPEGFSGWTDYVAGLGTLSGVEKCPVFYVIRTTLGPVGFWILCMAAFSAIVTGLIGHLVASGRLLMSLSKDGLFPKWLGGTDRFGNPVQAQTFIVLLSCLIPFIGRTAISWIVDVTSISTSIVYGYVSYCALATARRNGNRLVAACGVLGLAASVVFVVYFLMPNLWIVGAMNEESYLILIGWAILGLAFFRRIFDRDDLRRLGNSTVVWIALLFMVFFASHMWVRHATDRLVNDASLLDDDASEEVRHAQLSVVKMKLMRYSVGEMALIMVTLGLMFNIYAVISRREREAAKAKHYFFSTISHDIRTPLNAIIGYSQLLKTVFKGKSDESDAVNSIMASGKTLLGLVDDVLDLSKLETGTMEIALEPTDCPALIKEIVNSLYESTHMPDVHLRLKTDAMPILKVDWHRLRQITFNLVCNALKFTEHGYVEVRARFVKDPVGDTGVFTLEVEDTGFGISEEDKAHIAHPYVQVSSKMSRNGGTGLGLAITRQLAEAMGGQMTFTSELGRGSTFYVTVPGVQSVGDLRAASTEQWRKKQGETSDPAAAASADRPPEAAAAAKPAEAKPAEPAPAKEKLHILVVDDVNMNLMVMKALLKRVGSFDVETAMNGVEALKKLQDSGAAPFDLVLTDMWMPEMDGEGLAKAVRADPSLKSLPVYAITADVELENAYVERGFTGLYLKPVTFENLSECCSSVRR